MHSLSVCVCMFVLGMEMFVYSCDYRVSFYVCVFWENSLGQQGELELELNRVFKMRHLWWMCSIDRQISMDWGVTRNKHID